MIDGFQLREEIYSGRRRTVHRALREADNASVIIKSVTVGLSVDEEVTELEREFNILSTLSIDGVIRALELRSNAGGVHLLLEDHCGETLAVYSCRDSVDIAARLDIAIELIRIIAAVHSHGVLHKDINPTNVLINPECGAVTLIDFSISSRDTEERHPVSHPTVLEGTLAYLAPEQTGRMNRPVDYRSDYYSLGVTLFELFTGSLPFTASDPMELVHCHLAAPAPYAGDVNGDLPESICRVVRKLMEKAPEDRYQSAAGIQHDLRACRDRLHDGDGSEPFLAGSADVRDRFRVAKKLYGRGDELDELLRAFERVGRQGAELVLAAGYSGVGKSALVNALHVPITRRRGHFVSGKFDQLQRTVPYSAVVSALAEFSRQLLTEPEASLQSWSRLLLEAVGPNGQLVIDVVPEVELIIGPQEPPAAIGVEAARNRFQTVLRDFVHALCRRDHPLVVFLDDLQWADPASLDLVRSVLADEDAGRLLIIGAYRENEVDASHPLVGMIEALGSDGVPVNTIALGPLGRDDVRQLLTDTLNRDPGDLDDLLSLVIDKTEGNPFFLQQFLETLHHSGALEFDDAENRWTWDLPAIERMNFTENVVDLMVRRLELLPGNTQNALRLAACIGNQFDIGTLGLLSDDEPDECLAPAIELGLVISGGAGTRLGETRDGSAAQSRLRFLHDRVQQAAYSLLSEERRREAHLRIGRALVSELSPQASEERLFEVTDHLNQAIGLIRAEDERHALAQMNLRAARRAISTAAYEAARAYAVAGLSCLSADAWQTDYQLTRDLNRADVDAAYLRGDFERSQEIIETMLAKLQSPTERAELHNTLIIQQTLSGDYAGALETGLRGLAMLGIGLPGDDLDDALERELSAYRAAMNARRPQELATVSAMTSPEMRVAMTLLGSLCPMCYIANPAMCRVTATMMVNISLNHGHTADSPVGYAFFGLMHSSVLHDYERAYEFGQLAMDLAGSLGNAQQVCRTGHIFCAFINHWSQPLQDFQVINSRAFQVGLQAGELQFAGYHRYNRSLCQFHQGRRLGDLLPDLDEWARFGRRTRNQHATDPISAVQRVAMDLSGLTPEIASFAPDGGDDSAFLDDVLSRNGQPALTHYNVIKSQALYLYGRLDEARACAALAADGISFVAGHMSVAVQAFYESLIDVAAAGDESTPHLLERIERNQTSMRRWAKSCPENFLHKLLLVEAEVARLKGDSWRAAELFDEAISAALSSGYLQEEAIARERAGLFWLGRGFRRIAGLYLSEARHGFQLWGATRKADLLATQHADLLAGSSTPSDAVRASNVPFFTLVSSTGAALDFAEVMKATRTISGEISLDRLIERLLRIAVETAGAQSGLLLLEGEGGLFIEASSDVELGSKRLAVPVPLDSSHEVPSTVVNYVTRTGETLTLADAQSDPRFAGDDAIRRNGSKSVLCVPIRMRSDTIGLLYLEHRLAPNTFTPDRVQILESLAAQAAISLQNARLYEQRLRAEADLRDALNELNVLKNRLEAENEYFREEIGTQHTFEDIIGAAPGIKKVMHAIETVAPTDATTLIFGETGTGKELVARAIHSLSGRRDQMLVSVNCAALPSGLIESEFFGHEKGAFTGAMNRRTGRFELASGGTIFLDEIGELPLELQAKLLRVLQEGEFERVGGERPIKVDVRLVTATNRDLAGAVEAGEFRADLYYRLNVFPIEIPPLRERRDDVPLLVRHFVLQLGSKLGRRIETVPKHVMDALKAYPWPGNVRELQNVLERAVILSTGPRLELGDWIPDPAKVPGVSRVPTLQELEHDHILAVLKSSGWKVSGKNGAAEMLGIKPTTLEARMKRLDIRRPGR